MKSLDAIDRHLIALLQEDARRPLVALAKQVGLSRSAAQERLQRLQRSGVIAQFTLRLGGAAQRLQAWLLLRHAAGFSCDDVMPALRARPEVQVCYSVAGDVDLMVLVEVDHSGELAALREAVAALKGVDDVTTLPVLETPLRRC